MDELGHGEILRKGAEQFGAALDDSQVGMFMRYRDLLKEWNEKFNLTAIEDDRDIVIKHFIDSLTILPYMKNQGISLIDVGTGAGFPGIPVKIAFPSINVTLADSLEKRVTFLNEVIRELGLEGITAVHARAEDLGQNGGFREKFDVSTARAVANLPVLLEYCLPLVKPGGVFIAMKGSSTDELKESGKALQVLGGEFLHVDELTLPFSDIKRNNIMIKKLRHTPTNYPRKAGKPSKNPLV